MYAMPTPAERLDYAMDEACEKAVLAHPQTTKLRQQIKTAMQKAAKTAPAKPAKAKKR